jgi:hypothetical protein
MCSRGCPFRGHGGHGFGPRDGNNGGGHGRSGAGNKFPPCQLCGRTNNPIFKFSKRFDPTYMGAEKSANTTSSFVLTPTSMLTLVQWIMSLVNWRNWL